MKYGIIDDQTNKFLIVSDDKVGLQKTVAKHMPQFCVNDIHEYADSDIEYGFDGIYYLKSAFPEQAGPMVDDIRKQRRQYRSENCDYLTLEKVRKTALGCWTDEDEAAYVGKMHEIEDYISLNMPYPFQQEAQSEAEEVVVSPTGTDI